MVKKYDNEIIILNDKIEMIEISNVLLKLDRINKFLQIFYLSDEVDFSGYNVNYIIDSKIKISDASNWI